LTGDDASAGNDASGAVADAAAGAVADAALSDFQQPANERVSVFRRSEVRIRRLTYPVLCISTSPTYE